MGRQAIVAGTGFEGRADIIRNYCRDGLHVELRREPDNRHDPDAIAVYIETPGILGFGRRMRQIGYIKAPAADKLAKRIDGGLQIAAFVSSFYAPPGRDHPRVSLTLEY